LEATTAKVHDNRALDDLLHGGETSAWADKGYHLSAARQAAFCGPRQVLGRHAEGT
jgi:IS5 family transposase